MFATIARDALVLGALALYVTAFTLVMVYASGQAAACDEEEG